jgi:hypothetical protein
VFEEDLRPGGRVREDGSKGMVTGESRIRTWMVPTTAFALDVAFTVTPTPSIPTLLKSAAITPPEDDAKFNGANDF